MRIKCVEFLQQGESMYIGKISLKDLFALNYKIDEWKPSLLNSPDQGYQRAPEPARARRFGNYVNNRKISPPTLLLSIRQPDAGKMAKVTDRSANSLVEMEINEKCPVYVVDGQHRVRGL